MPRQSSMPLSMIVVLLLAHNLSCGCSQSSSSSTNPPIGSGGSPTGSPSTTHPPFQLSSRTEGLQPAHVGAVPLVEIDNCPPARRNGDPIVCDARRLYRDGAYYLTGGEGTPFAGQWTLLSHLQPDGVSQLEDLFAEICDGTAPGYQGIGGSRSYRVTSPRCTREFVVIGIPSGGLARLNEVSNIINHNMQPIPADPPTKTQ